MKSVSDDDILWSILMFPTFETIFKFMRKNIFFILLAAVLYLLFIFFLWMVAFGSFSKALDDFSIFVTSALNIGPPHDIFTILNFPFVFPPWDLPLPIFYGGIYYIFLFIAIIKVISHSQDSNSGSVIDKNIKGVVISFNEDCRLKRIDFLGDHENN